MRRLLPALLAGAVTLCMLGLTLARREPIKETDEAAWIYSSYYFRLAFIERDFRSPDWRHEDAYDHPPLAKFYYGAWLATVGGVPSTIAAKESWLVRTEDVFNLPRFKAQLNEEIPARVLLRARLAAAAAFAAACGLIGLAAALIAGPWAGAVACAIPALLPLTLHVGCEVLSDQPLAALLAACALSQTLLARALARGERRPWAAAAAGVLIGLAFDTKISAALEAALLPLSLAAALPRARWKDAALATLLAGAAAAATAYACNPSFWGDPLTVVARMFEHRLAMLDFQVRVFVENLNPSLPYRLSEMLKALFGGPDAFSQLTGLLAAGLCCAAVETLPGGWRAAENDRWRRVPLVHALAWIAASGWTYRLQWDRYLLPATPFAGLLAALGLVSLRGAQPRRLAAIAAVLLAAASFCASYSTPRYWQTHPLEYERARRDAIRGLCERRPDLCPRPPSPG